MPAQVKVDISDAIKKLGGLQQNLKKALLVGVAHEIFLMSRASFDRQASPEGAAWAPLSPRYAGTKARLFPGKGILQRRGGLLRSLFETVEGNTATIGATMPYAAIHQFGGVAGRSGPFKKKDGKRAQIPARPFLPTVQTAESAAAAVAEEIVRDAIAQAGLQ